MAKLTEPQKLFIIQALACFDTPTQVVDAVREEFGIEIHRRQVAEYDPSKISGRGQISAKLVALFESTRAAFLKETSQIPIANQAVRLRTLQRLATLAENQRNVALAAQLVEQAAKEVGGAFTNRREITGKGGGPIEQASTTTSVTLEEFQQIARRVADEV
jgi:hypothetical protein